MLVRTDIGYEKLQEFLQHDKISLEEFSNLDILEKIQLGQFMRKGAMFSKGVGYEDITEVCTIIFNE